jgi:hypothetical protein
LEGFEIISFIGAKERYDDFSLTSQMNGANEIGIFGILGYINFGFAQHLCVITKRELATTVLSMEVWKITGVEMIRVHRSSTMTLDEEEQERISIEAIISSILEANCYYSLDLDLTNSLQQAHAQGRRKLNHISEPDFFSHLDPKYVWNWHLLKPLMKEEYHPYIIPIISGYIGSFNRKGCQVLLRSRLSRFRVGARYWRRGINSVGDCAMDCTTEISLFYPNYVASFCQLRGSTPVYWRHMVIDPLKTPDVDFSYADSETSQHATKLHFMRIEKEYGSPVAALDLLDPIYSDLSKAYEESLEEFDIPEVIYAKKDPYLLRYPRKAKSFVDTQIQEMILSQAYFVCRLENLEFEDMAVSEQRGIFRYSLILCIRLTNCHINTYC